MSKLPIISVDTMQGKSPHVRHAAVVNEIRKPVVDKDHRVKILSSIIAVTLCGRTLSNFMNADKTSLRFTDGSVFAVECERCFPK
jgi:hypothetical protein